MTRLEVIASASGTFLYTASEAYGGMAVYRIDGSGTPELVDSAYFTAPMVSMGALALGWAQFGSQGRLIFGVTQSGDLLASNTAGPGDLGAFTTVYLSDAQSPWLQNGFLSTELSGGADMIYVADALSGALSGYRIFADGSLNFVSSTAAPSGSASIGEVLLVPVRVGETDFLLRADTGFQGVVAYEVNANGSLVRAGSLGAENGLGVNTPTVMEVVQAWGKTFVLLGAAESGTLSVMELTETGSLRPCDHVLDSLDTRFDAISALEVVEVNGRVFIVAGGGDDGLSLFTILPDGRLVFLQALAHETGYGLQNVQSISSAIVGNELRLYVASETASGLSTFVINLAQLGTTVNGATSGSNTISGSLLDDMLISNSTGSDTLIGGDGDDILVSGEGSTYMYGGRDDDTFVIRASQSRQFVMDYQSGDRIDLTGLPMLRSTSQLVATPTERGILLVYQGFEIEVVARNGRPMSLTDLWPALSFGFPDRVMVLGELPGERMNGSSTGDHIMGSLGRDTIYGGSGHDTIFGDGSSDRIDAGDGNDQIDVGAGNDTILGRAGNDSIETGDGANLVWGGDGNDTLRGGQEADSLYGENGNDRIEGGDGDDFLNGAAGADTLYGGVGNDTLHGGGHDNSLDGGAGDDRLNGAWGNDTLVGGAGNDTLRGNSGNDRITDTSGSNVLNGGTGADTITAGDGDDLIISGPDGSTSGDLADSISGGGGHDRIHSGYGNDTLRAGLGNDTLRAGQGDDFLYGEGGNDLLSGGLGDDWINGGGGNDTLAGDGGNDYLLGGAGYDFFRHDGTLASGSDVIADFDGAQDTLFFTNRSARESSFTLRWRNTGGDDGLLDAQIIYEPTGEVIWTLLDAEGEDHIWLSVGNAQYDLL